MSEIARHWINGEACGTPQVESINPADGTVIGRIAAGGASDADAAIAAARRAFDCGTWHAHHACAR